jgi:ABC-2 type transport system ATP-binding protein
MIVRVEGLSKRFPTQRSWPQILRAPFARPTTLAVTDVSFEVREREIFGLLGQNGAGKTTLFKMLATLISADEGVATVDGHDVAADGLEVRRLLAPVLANERSLYWRLSARENLRLYCALQGIAGAAARDEIDRVLTVTALRDTALAMVGTFSTGMRQRLLIARALLGRPRVLLLDEPTRSLDPISARDFRTFLRETIVGVEGCTVLLATHDAEEVWELCDRVGVLERGRLLAVDATSVLRDRAGRSSYEIWLRVTDGPNATAGLAAAGHTLERLGPAGEPGWDRFRCAIGGGATEAAAVHGILAARGREVARFDRAAPALADLIERVLTAASPTSGDALNA